MRPKPCPPDRNQATGDRGTHRQGRCWPAGTLVTFHEDSFPDGPVGLIAYVDRLKGTAQLRPDMKLVIKRAWGDPQSPPQRIVPVDQGLGGCRQKSGQVEHKAD